MGRSMGGQPGKEEPVFIVSSSGHDPQIWGEESARCGSALVGSMACPGPGGLPPAVCCIAGAPGTWLPAAATAVGCCVEAQSDASALHLAPSDCPGRVLGSTWPSTWASPVSVSTRLCGSHPSILLGDAALTARHSQRRGPSRAPRAPAEKTPDLRTSLSRAGRKNS